MSQNLCEARVDQCAADGGCAGPVSAGRHRADGPGHRGRLLRLQPDPAHVLSHRDQPGTDNTEPPATSVSLGILLFDLN